MQFPMIKSESYDKALLFPLTSFAPLFSLEQVSRGLHISLRVAHSRLAKVTTEEYIMQEVRN